MNALSVDEAACTADLKLISTAEKGALFRRLFRGRTDVYPIRWESKSSSKSGYAPACANEWRASSVRNRVSNAVTVATAY
jgi:hypothetical protein